MTAATAVHVGPRSRWHRGRTAATPAPWPDPRTHGPRRVAGLGHAGGPRRPDRAGDALRVQRRPQGVEKAADQEGTVGIAQQQARPRRTRRRGWRPVPPQAPGRSGRPGAPASLARLFPTCGGPCATDRAAAAGSRQSRARAAVPDRTTRSWPPPCSTGTRSKPRAARTTPGTGAADLVGRCRVSASTRPPARKLTGGGQAACPRRRCGCGCYSYSMQPQGQISDRLDGAHLVVRPHVHTDQRHIRRVPHHFLGQRGGLEHPGLAYRQPGPGASAARAASAPGPARRDARPRWPAPGGAGFRSGGPAARPGGPSTGP